MFQYTKHIQISVAVLFFSHFNHPGMKKTVLNDIRLVNQGAKVLESRLSDFEATFLMSPTVKTNDIPVFSLSVLNLSEGGF